MKTSQKGINLIKEFEGCKLTAYKPVSSEKYFTIGYGHYGADVKSDLTITEQEAENYLRADLQKFETGVDKAVKVGITQNMFDALVSFTYNCGIGALQSSTLLKKLNAGDFNGAANEFLKWNKSGSSVLPGLTRRRQAERALFLEAPTLTQVQSGGSDLPYSVRTTSNLNIRKSPNGQIIGGVLKGTTLKVWAIQTVGNDKWGKNEKGFFSLKYTERI